MACPFTSSGGPAPHPLPSKEISSDEETAVLPQPPEHLFGLLGNLPDMDPSFPIRPLWKLAELYGPIYKLRLGQETVVVSGQKYVNEVCDEERFEKTIASVLTEVRALLGDGLFTAHQHESSWWKAHRVLIPVFGPIAIRKMFDQMMDIASQMILKWDRLGKENEIDLADDFTRLAFDTIAICAFGYRFNQFLRDNPHPFAQEMADVLIESGKRASRTSIENSLHRWSENTRQENIRKMHAVADEIVADRKKHPQPDSKDLLNTMLMTPDPETGEILPDETIRNNMVTLLVAGHETTSSTLGFCCYNLMKNPETLLKAQQQVDQVVGDGVLELKHLSQLTYIDAAIKETLRLSSPINGFLLHPKKDTKLGGKYPVTTETAIQVLLRPLHHDPAVWGDDAEEFKPERMLDGGFEALPPNSWKPFGNGMRACIGRFFATQEMIINLALILQRFQIELADPSYELKLKSTLTIKAFGLKMKVRRRPGKSLMTGLPGGIPSKIARFMQKGEESSEKGAAETSKQFPVSVFFGGNSGTCKALAEDIETKATSHGMKVSVASLDSATEHLPTDHPVVIITASYEGQPPDNARKFVKWLELSAKEKRLDGVNYTVFGVGNSDWASTFHKIPKQVDDLMYEMGANRFVEVGSVDVKKDPIGPYEDWSDKLWEGLSNMSGSKVTASTELKVSVQPSLTQKILGSEEINAGTVLANYELAGADIGPAKKHMEIRLPEGAEYTTGDYLVVLPRNPPDTVQRVLQRFKLNEDDYISISGTSKKFLPTQPTSAIDFFSTSVELSVPVTRRQLETIASHTGGDLRPSIQALAQESNYATLLSKRTSILDILDAHSVDLPLSTYLDMLPALTPRQYSISSSPLAPSAFRPATGHPSQGDLTTVTLTYDVLTVPSLSNPQSTFHGVCSSYLSSRQPGDRIACFMRPTAVGFRLPPDPATPILLFAAGTGIAPMLAFLAERAAILDAGQKPLGPAALFFGCRDPDKDFIYKEQLAAWQEKGVVKVFPAFSRAAAQGRPKYVQDAVWEEREMVAGLFRDGGRIYVCGSAERLAKGAAEVCKRIYAEKRGVGSQEAEEWFESVRTVRYVADVY